MQQEQSDSSIKEALFWILQVLEEQRISYQIVGGLAARVYGAVRPIVDIDMYIPSHAANSLVLRVKDFITKPLTRYVEDQWDIEYFQLRYKGQKIEFGLSPGARLLDKRTGKWVDQIIDFEKSVSKEFDGVQLFVMPMGDLIHYKSLLNREVDKIDISEMQELVHKKDSCDGY